MNNIKPKYWLLVGIFAMITALVLYCINLGCIDVGFAKVLLSGVAISISLLAIGMSDRSQKKLKMRLEVWNTNRDTKQYVDNIFTHKFAFEVINDGKESLEGLIFSFRIPQKIVDERITENEQNNTTFKFGETLLVQNDMIKSLGITVDDNSIRFEHYLHNIQDWKKGRIRLTVSANGYLPKTFEIDPSMNENFLKSGYDEKKRIKLS